MRTKLRAVIFDLDDTLLIDEEETRRAMMMTAQHYKTASNAKFTDCAIEKAREIWQQNPQIDWCKMLGHSALEGLWCDYSGTDEKLADIAAWQSRYLRSVWEYACEKSGIAVTEVNGVSKYFQKERNRLHPWMPGAKEIIDFVSEHYQMAILTNGISTLQWKKIKRSGIEHHFHIITVSGDFGIGKPDPRPFRHTLERLEVSPEESLMVGNNPLSDIAGAQATGMLSCWLRLEGCDFPMYQKPADFTIDSLASLRKLPIFA